MQTTHISTESEAVKAFRTAILDKLYEKQTSLTNEIGICEAKNRTRKADYLRERQMGIWIAEQAIKQYCHE